jgi:asparagine synthase (glutamine-hydrolysing)
MTVGFTVCIRGGETEFDVRDHGLADRPRLVTQATIAKVHAVLMGRLYYREELRAGLNLTALDANSDNDAALALAVYRKRGLEGLERLEGDFALVVWDADAQRLVAMRDPMGGYPIFHSAHFHTAQRGALAVSTSMDPLLDRLGSRTLNQEYLADYLMSPIIPVEESADHRAAYDGVQRVLPGSIVVLHPASGKVEQRRYWDWLERRVDPGTDDVEQLGELCRERLRAAVRTRLRGRTASHLSGGMDSTGVALIARDCLQGREPVHALSLVYERFPYLARERTYVESGLAEPGITAHRINGDQVLDYDGVDTVPPHDEPFPGLLRLWSIDRAMIGAAAQQGVATVMTGYGADDIFDIQPFHLTEMLRSGRLWAAGSEASRWARAYDENLWQVLRPCGVDNLLPAWMRMGAVSWLRGGYASWGRSTEWHIPPWIRPDFARRMDLRGRGLANLHTTYYACRSPGVSMALWGIRLYYNAFSRVNLAAPHGIMFTHPFLDPRVFSLGLGILSRFRPQPGAQKPILAAALRGILPESILNRPGKGHFNEAFFTGLSRNARSLEALVEQAPASVTEFLDKPVLLDCLQRAALGNAPDARALIPLNSTLSLLLWLNLQQKRERSQPRPARPARKEHTGVASAAA